MSSPLMDAANRVLETRADYNRAAQDASFARLREIEALNRLNAAQRDFDKEADALRNDPADKASCWARRNQKSGEVGVQEAPQKTEAWAVVDAIDGAVMAVFGLRENAERAAAMGSGPRLVIRMILDPEFKA